MSDRADFSRCRACHSPLTLEVGGEWCPRCALAAAFAPVPESGTASAGGGLFTVSGHVVLAELGRGAAGIVYRARQEHPAREVALKILRPHELGSAESLARFRLEAATVAALDHPVILPVLAVGEYDGLPYFTMKLCTGGSLAERLGKFHGHWQVTATLVALLAEAVQQAHARGVLHRDLKPGNLLFDEEDRPFISDFGLAKLIDGSGAGAPVTRPLLVMGTPGYLAPEVLQGGASHATTAADIFALGAILHELLTGSPPPATAAAEAARPGVPRDLAVITAKCLQTEPGTRYATAEALAADLRAWLDGQPIVARSAGWLENTIRWCRRYPGRATSAGLATLIVLLLAVGGPLIALRLDRARRTAEAERARATTESAISKAIADFLQNDLLAQASPDQQPDRNLTLRTVLDRAAKKIDGRFAGQPLVAAAILDTLADTYRSLGEYALMQHHAERSIEIYRRQLGEEDPQTLAGRGRLADALFQQGKIPEAESLSRTVLALQGRVSGPEHPDTLRTMETLGNVLIWAHKFPEAEQLCAQTVTLEKRAFGPEHPRTVGSLVNLAEVYSNELRYAEAEALLLQAWEIRRRVIGPDHPDTLDSMNHLGMLYEREGNFPAARQIIEQGVQHRTRTLGPEHPDTLIERHNLAMNYLHQGLFPQAENVERTILPINRRIQGPAHQVTIFMMEVLAQSLAFQGKFAEAESLLQQAWEACRQSIGPVQDGTLYAMSRLGFVYQQEGKLDEAEILLRQTLEICERVQGPDNSLTLQTGENLGRVLLMSAKYSAAEALLRHTLEARRRLFPDEWRTAQTASLLGEALLGEKRLAEAEPLLLAGFKGLKAQSARIPASADVSFRHSGDCLVKLYQDWGKSAESESWRRQLAGPGSTP